MEPHVTDAEAHDAAKAREADAARVRDVREQQFKDIEHRFGYHSPAGIPGRAEQHEEARAIVKHAAHNLSILVPAGREKSLMLTHLEEALFWANAGIARQ